MFISVFNYTVIPRYIANFEENRNVVSVHLKAWQLYSIYLCRERNKESDYSLCLHMLGLNPT